MGNGQLLHSLAEFREIIFKCFQITNARKIVEIGSGEGKFTQQLLLWGEKSNGTIYCIEPKPTQFVKDLNESFTVGTLIQGKSLEVLSELEACDAYLIDSDHNYYTTLNELTILDNVCRSAGKFYTAFVHDIGILSGRRDFYFDPESIPPEAVHPYSHINHMIPVTEMEFGSEGKKHLAGALACAKHEGGPCNGVLTAVEDFLNSRSNLVFKNIPCIFGLAVIYSKESVYEPELTQFLEPYNNNPLLARIEENRINLYVDYIKSLKKFSDK